MARWAASRGDDDVVTTLVTGAAGFAGSHLVDLLTERGERIVAWHRPGGAVPAERRGVTWQAVDITDGPAVAAAVAASKPRVVYHCAAEAHVGRSFGYSLPTFQINVLGTHHLVEGLRQAGLGSRVVVPSSAMVYASSSEALTEGHPLGPHSPYALSKLAQEMTALRAREDGLHVTIARAFNHIGPRQNPFFAASGFARRIADIEAGKWEPVLAVGNLDARRDIHDVRDTVRAYERIVEHGTDGRIYNVCSGRAIQIGALVDKLLAHARVRITIRVDPARYRPTDVPLLLGDPTRVQSELGWLPEISLDQTLADLLEYWRRHSARG